MPTRGRFVRHVRCLVHDGAVRSSPCRPHHENFGRNLYHMFVPAYSASQPFVFVLSCGIRVASKSNFDSIPFPSGVLIFLCEYQSFSIIEFVISISFQLACFSSSGSDHCNICKINYQFFSTVFTSSVPSFLYFPTLPPFFFKDSDFLIKYHLIDEKPLHSFSVYVLIRLFS